MPADAKPSRWSWNAFAIAAVSTLVVLGSVEAAGVFFLSQKQVRDAKRGWNLVPVLRATHPLEPGAMLSRADFEVASLPEQFVTESVVKPVDLGIALGQQVQLPMAPGDWLTRAHLTPGAGASCTSMLKAAAAQVHQEAQPKVLKLIAAVDALDGGTP
jgi:Flp pilus assembly protein CpaB